MLVNIHSHVLGAGIFLALPIWLYSEMGPRYAASTAGDITVFGLYLSGVAICFMLSAAFHTLCSHSAQGFRFGIQLDFLGIILLMWSANLPLVFYTFPNEHTLQMIYWSLVSIRGGNSSSNADISITAGFSIRGSRKHGHLHAGFPQASH